jgi:hypothetical protein
MIKEVIVLSNEKKGLNFLMKIQEKQCELDKAKAEMARIRKKVMSLSHEKGAGNIDI